MIIITCWPLTTKLCQECTFRSGGKEVCSHCSIDNTSSCCLSFLLQNRLLNIVVDIVFLSRLNANPLICYTMLFDFLCNQRCIFTWFQELSPDTTPSNCLRTATCRTRRVTPNKPVDPSVGAVQGVVVLGRKIVQGDSFPGRDSCRPGP